MQNREIYFEFSKIYKRVMDIELSLKALFFNASNLVAQDTKFKRLIPYFDNTKLSFRYAKYNYQSKLKSRNKIKDIISSKATDDIKFRKFLKIAYLADILNIITEYPLLYKDNKFCHCLYVKKESLNTLKSYASNLISLRNIIMHFNIADYNINRIKYIKTLVFWESILDCNNNFIHELEPIKPTIFNILMQIKSIKPELINGNDRVIVDVFDDIAFMNNVNINDLPQYWSILRQLFLIKKNDKLTNEQLEDELKELTNQLSLPVQK